VVQPVRDPHRHERVAAEREEVVVHLDRPVAQRRLPTMHEHCLQDIAVRTIVWY
jgi:hypothetical protein